MEDDGYETWQCLRDHYCATDITGPWFCFVYHETNKVFTPWGHNSQARNRYKLDSADIGP